MTTNLNYKLKFSLCSINGYKKLNRINLNLLRSALAGAAASFCEERTKDIA